jgi:hypothetical protein
MEAEPKPDEEATEPEAPTPEHRSLGGRIALGALRFLCFVGVGAMLFLLRTPFGALPFLLTWIALDRTLPSWLRRIGSVALLLLVPFIVYVTRWDNAVNFGVMQIDTYVPDSIQPAGSTKVKVHVFPLFLHESMTNGGIQVNSLTGPHEIWLELKDKDLAASELEVTEAVIVSGDQQQAIAFEPAELPSFTEGWSPYRPSMKEAENVSYWRQVRPLDLSGLGPDLRLRFTLKQGEGQQQMETTLKQNQAMDSGLIGHDAWQR